MVTPHLSNVGFSSFRTEGVVEPLDSSSRSSPASSSSLASTFVLTWPSPFQRVIPQKVAKVL